MITIKSDREIQLMRESAEKLRNVFAEVKTMIRPGVKTAALDQKAEKVIQAQNAKPAFKGYRGYPASLCISINEEVVHGIPSTQRIIREGDIISIDAGLIWHDFFSDSARTWTVGKVPSHIVKMIQVTKQALYEGMDQMKVGARIGDISAAIQHRIESNGFGVVRDYVGHGIGKAMHEDPQVPNYGTPGRGQKLVAGMALALEPMVTEGDWQVKVLEDGWTVVTKDGKIAAHYEDTIAVTENGPENLTGEQVYQESEICV